MVKKPAIPFQSNVKLNQTQKLLSQRTAVQPKLAPARPGGPSHGVIQAYMQGGFRVLQARMMGSGARLRQKDGNNQTVQRKSNGNSDAFRVSLRPKTGGQQIPDQVRTKMESALGMDFSDVRIHVGPEASSIGALAYTWGTNIHFAPGQYNPHSLQGQKILGHELWHVVQQKSGRVANPFGDGVAVVQDYGLEAEADRMALKAALTPVTVKMK
ncbi:MAG TPA: DUF4157 domain-containing protein [Blastocatellia bacterium]|nr:DUF4157 domain-containing protein [Blastocatellia bacterium]